MNRKFFKGKISRLTDDRVLALLNIRFDANREIFGLAMDEANRRGLSVPPVQHGVVEAIDAENNLEKLHQWNWAAFLFAPCWTLAHKLDRYTLLVAVPGLNILAMLYLGFRGNGLAYAKSHIRRVDDFLIYQKDWTRRVIRLYMFWLALIACVWILSQVLLVLEVSSID